MHIGRFDCINKVYVKYKYCSTLCQGQSGILVQTWGGWIKCCLLSTLIQTRDGRVKKSFKLPMGVISSGKSRDRQHNGQKKTEKQWSTKHYTENERLSKTNPNEFWWYWRVSSSCSTIGKYKKKPKKTGVFFLYTVKPVLRGHLCNKEKVAL
jgi:hypothetical protein